MVSRNSHNNCLYCLWGKPNQDAFKCLKRLKHWHAEVLFKQCLDNQKVVLGESHPDTINSILAAIFNQISKTEVVQSVLAKMIVFGDSNPDTFLRKMRCLAKVSSKQTTMFICLLQVIK